jgi:hypothetical protein
MRRLFIGLLLFTLTLTSVAQQTSAPTNAEAAIKRKADSLAPGAHISVVRVHAQEEFGDFVFNDQQGFTFHDIDLKTDVTLKYSDVRKIKDGYGGYNSVQGRHTDRTKGLIVGAILIGTLVALIGTVAAAKD